MPAPLPPPVQIAYAVRDLPAAAARFASTTGAGPFFVRRHIPLASARVGGAVGDFDHSSAYGQWGAWMVELVEEHTPPIVEPGRVHHLACFVEDTAAAVAACVGRGWPEVLWAVTVGGFPFAFCDARHELGHLVELYAPTDRLRAFYAMVREASIGWDGADPVRELT